MTDRLVRNLFLALAALAAVYGIARFISGGGTPSSPAAFELSSIVDATIDSVIIGTRDGDVVLSGGDEWTVNGYEATRESGEAIERALEESRVSEPVSRNPENHERMGVAEGQGRRLHVYAGGEERLSLIVSDKGQTFDDAYVRRPADEEVRILRGNLVDLIRRNVDGWRNKQIVSVTSDDVQRLELEYPDETLALARDSLGWRFAESELAAKSDDVQRIVQEIAALRAIGFADDSLTAALSWERATANAKVLGPGDASLVEIAFLARETSGYFVKSADKSVVYTISQYSGDQILKRAVDLSAPVDAVGVDPPVDPQ